MIAIDALLKAVVQKKNPSVLGLDTDYSYLPGAMRTVEGDNPLERAAKAVFLYNCALVDALCDIVPAVKVQAAYYEKLGYYGMKTFADTIRYAVKAGLVVIGDVKRNDIGTTAEAYANAYLGESGITDAGSAFPCDMITVNPYLGSDGIMPFVSYCKENGKGIFVLVKTSNKSSGEFQDMLAEGRPMYMHVARRVAEWGSGCIGEMGYSAVGAVVGATYPQQGEQLREQMPRTCFLVPGYGAQGGKASDLPGMFDKNALGAVVNASRSLICAYKKPEYADIDYTEAARREAIRMRDDIGSALSAAGKVFRNEFKRNVEG